MLHIKPFYLFLSLLFLYNEGSGQTEASSENNIDINKRNLFKIERNMNSINEDIKKKTIKAVVQLQKQESRLKDKLALKDTGAVKILFDINNKYPVLIQKIESAVAGKRPVEYVPELDSLQTGLKFLEQVKLPLHVPLENWVSTINSVNGSIDGVRTTLDQANEIESYVRDRKRLLKEQFEKYGIAKELKKLERDFFYYQQQLLEYKSMLKDRKKLGTKAMAELRRLPAFTEFMKKNSQIAQLFHLPPGVLG
jgi:hypothetical protein